MVGKGPSPKQGTEMLKNLYKNCKSDGKKETNYRVLEVYGNNRFGHF